MPELPDVTVYVECLQRTLAGRSVERVRLASPFLLRSVEPPLGAVVGKTVLGARRLGKRIAIELEGELFLVLHLMIAGRLRWSKRGAALPGRIGLLALDFAHGALILTEAGSKRRAALHLVRGREALADFERGGLEVFDATLDEFERAIRAENHTLKRALTDPSILSGIGNAYSDEILHRARLSPVALSQRLSPEEVRRLYEATRSVLAEWTERLRAEAAGGFPTRVTAFREGMAVHGRYREPCPDCGAPVQRIRYTERETNYCPSCQTGGRVLADRSLSKLLKSDWPRTLEELEERGRAAR